MSVDGYFALIGHGDSVDYAYERGLPRPVRPEQTENPPFANVDAHAVQSCMSGIALHHVVHFHKIIHFPYCILSFVNFSTGSTS